MTYEIMQIIISLAAALITAFLIPYIKGRIGEAKSVRINGPLFLQFR
jgi:hypothetical protein